MDRATEITQIIHERADKELYEQVSRAFALLWNSIFVGGLYGSDVTIDVEGYVPKEAQIPEGGPRSDYVRHLEVRADNALKALQKAVIAASIEGNRARFVEEFVKKVDDLGGQIDELRDEISNIQQH